MENLYITHLIVVFDTIEHCRQKPLELIGDRKVRGFGYRAVHSGVLRLSHLGRPAGDRRTTGDRSERRAAGRRRSHEGRGDSAATTSHGVHQCRPTHSGGSYLSLPCRQLKELSPAEIIKMKRVLDSFVYGKDAVLSPTFASAHHNFMKEAFAAAGNSRDESRIRSSAACRPRSPDQGGSELEQWFTGEDNRWALCTPTDSYERIGPPSFPFRPMARAQRGNARHSTIWLPCITILELI